MGYAARNQASTPYHPGRLRGTAGVGAPVAVACIPLVWLVMACNAPQTTRNPPSIDVRGELFARDPGFGDLATLMVRGSYLWVGDASGDPFLHVIDVTSGQVIVSFGRHGDGPGDFQSIPWLMADPADPEGVIVYDRLAGRLTRLGVGADSQVEVRSTTLVPVSSPHPAWIAPVRGGYVGWLRDVRDSAHRWILFGHPGGAPTAVPGPLVGPERVGFRQRLDASSSLQICERPDGTRFAVVYGSAGRIELHDSAARFLGLADVPDSSNGDFQQQPGRGLIWNGLHFWYASCAASEPYLFALYAGTRVHYPGPPPNISRQVQIYDWHGRLIATLALSTGIDAIALDVKRGVLYGLGGSGTEIYRFDLPAEYR
jgi:hypothetical protein